MSDHKDHCQIGDGGNNDKRKRGGNWNNWQSMSAIRLAMSLAKWVLHVHFAKMILV